MIMQLAIGFVFGFVFAIVISIGLAPVLRAVVVAAIALLTIGAILTEGMEGFANWANPFWFGLIVGVVVFSGGARIWRRPPP
jgi:hypothetical protein